MTQTMIAKPAHQTAAPAQKSSAVHADSSETALAQRRLKAQLAGSAVQKKELQRKEMLNAPAQLEGIEEEELLQGKFYTAQLEGVEEEELLQGKFDTAQLMEVDEEEPLQGKFDTAQLEGVDEEELLQGKFDTAQLEGIEEEELLQGKFAPAQLEGVEEEEILQGKFDTAQLEGVEEEEILQGKFEQITGSAEPIHRKVDPTTTVAGVPVNDDPSLETEADVMGAKAAQFVPETGTDTLQQEKKPNDTGLPDNLKAGVENLSGMSLDGVKVHYNSDKPAQLNAHAYAQGTDIHVAPGQEKHLPHEAWHVVQQGQKSSKPVQFVAQLQAVEIYCNINGTYRTQGRKGKTRFNERDLFLVRHDAHPQGHINYGKMAIRELRNNRIIPPHPESHDIQYVINTRSKHVG